jgi:hypothetical protein
MVNFIDSRNTGEPAARSAESSEIAGFASKNCEKSAAGTEMQLIRLGAAARRLRILTGVLFILLIVACRCLVPATRRRALAASPPFIGLIS